MQWAKMIRNQHSRNQRESNDVNPVVPAPSWAWSGRCRTDICWTVQLPGNFGVIPLMHQSHANAFSCKFHITGTCIHVSKRAAHSTLAEDGCHEPHTLGLRHWHNFLRFAAVTMSAKIGF